MAVPQVAARETAIVFGIGPGLGWALAKRLMTENLQVGRLRDEAKRCVQAAKGAHGSGLAHVRQQRRWNDSAEGGHYSCPRQTQECVFGRPAVHLLCIFFAAE